MNSKMIAGPLMITPKWRFALPALLAVCLLGSGLGAQRITTSFTSGVFKGPFSGKVLLYLSKEDRQPKDAMAGVWFRLIPGRSLYAVHAGIQRGLPVLPTRNLEKIDQ